VYAEEEIIGSIAIPGPLWADFAENTGAAQPDAATAR